MEKVNEIRTGRHCIFNLLSNLVFLTKFRGQVFTPEILEALQKIFSEVCKDFESNLVGFAGGGDYVRLLVAYPPKIAISNLVNSLKGVSSRVIRKRYFDLIEPKLWNGALWSPSYFAGSGDEYSLSLLHAYLEDNLIHKADN